MTSLKPCSLPFLVLAALAGAASVPAADDAAAIRVTEDDRAIKVETDRIEAVIP